MPAQSARRTSVSRIIKTLLTVTDERQLDLATVLGVDEATISRKMKNGKWTIDDLDSLAEHFRRPITVFFMDPDDIFGGPDQQANGSRWITTSAGQGRLFDDVSLELRLPVAA